MQNANSHKKMYKAGKNWVAAMAATVAVAMVPMAMTTSVSADESAQPTSSWRAKTVEDVQTAVQAAGETYVVQAGDTLSTIASATQLTTDEIAAANGISDVHFILVGQEIKLTADAAVASEAPVVASEAAPAAEVAPVEAPVVEQAPVVEAPVVEAPVAEEVVADEPVAQTPNYNTDMTAVPGNSYYAGQCTWYVKNTLSWVGNFWGNANQWAASAAAAGRLVDSNPTVGSVAVFMPGVAGASSYGHVAVVTGVNGGMVTISEMNAQGEYVVSSRTISPAGVLFIH
ncbi:CHAP domain-containing protein [Weissella confusa]|uniref:CHAP domain-containing protein n=1 Tax=Weissella confusa TaxID=1583 RepID=UPI000704CA0F|nr:CHAP domain-containing protein [Weissella confusa]KRN23197.1 CHAP domain-containing protein [Weissella confusa]MBJ7641547.1 CHAP domain-containing protein [Weissella confusa]MBJ7655822.1 CHAP domain-containing protein [Weissella confusa]MBJ7698693.1 CHAP domain-containing protein [Weissella confusa]MBS7550643.1 CHAP domain-containing protein [Weissella confusa]